MTDQFSLYNFDNKYIFFVIAILNVITTKHTKTKEGRNRPAPLPAGVSCYHLH